MDGQRKVRNLFLAKALVFQQSRSVFISWSVAELPISEIEEFTEAGAYRCLGPRIMSRNGTRAICCEPCARAQ